MYEQVETDLCIRDMETGALLFPVATLMDGYGGQAHILIDDHCYVLCLRRNGPTYVWSNHWFEEAVKVLKRLPLPSTVGEMRMKTGYYDYVKEKYPRLLEKIQGQAGENNGELTEHGDEP